MQVLFLCIFCVFFFFENSYCYQADYSKNSKEMSIKELQIRAEEAYIRSDSATATIYANRMLKLAYARKDSRAIVDAYNCFAMIYSFYDRGLSLVYAKKAVDLAENIDYLAGTGFAFYYKAISYFGKDYETSKKYLNKSNAIGSTEKNSYLSALSYLSIGEISEFTGMQNLALYNYLKSFELFESFINMKSSNIEKYNYATLLNNLAISYKNLDKFDESMSFSKLSISISEKIGDYWVISSAYNNLGNLYYRKGLADSALLYFDKGLKLMYKLGDSSNLADIIMNIGNCYAAQNKNNDAIEKYKTAYEYFKINGRIDGLIKVFINLGDVCYEQKEYKKSKEYFYRALDLTKNYYNNAYLSAIYKGLFKNYNISEDYRKSLHYYQLYVQYKDSVFNLEKAKEIGMIEARFQFEKQIADEKRREEIRLQKEEEEIDWRNTLQYSGILLIIIFMLVFAFLTGKFQLKVRIAEGIIFVTFILVFEFILVLLDPYTDDFTKGAPLSKLGINFVLALLIFPLHSFFEEKLKSRLPAKKKNNYKE